MTNAFSSMEYPHWLIIAGVVLLVLGFVGLAFVGFAFRQNDAEAEETANGNEQARSEFQAEPAQTQAANRKAKLAEQTRERHGGTVDL